ncbi:DUF1566 domain-containing protein [Lamprobacter modestohalophilus]|uniref:Lcl domain-containing protein n=1 Tax=Lamprobacter modestohalophilus TaxID=1064514 RepID=UPI002ADED917|nr:DUF1566 domain-containing protein [Lamprobacter modestohalophilus]MEA1048322.1 DUF1566 domain-containing protein [Lamprobacter modestohalophilus]
MVINYSRSPLAGALVVTLLVILFGARLVASEQAESTTGYSASFAQLARYDQLVDAKRILEPLQAPEATSPVIVSLEPSSAVLELAYPGADAADVLQPPAALATAESRAVVREEIAAEREWLLSQLGDSGIAVTRRFRYQFGFAAEVSLDVLERLLEHPSVLSIEPDRRLSSRAGADSSEVAHLSALIAHWEAAIDRLDEAPETAARALASRSADQAFVGTEPCDLLLPALAQAAANARSAGLSLFAPAGDDGLCDQLPWPACLSDVAAVGAVYNAGQGLISWCVDSSSCAEKTPVETCESGYRVVEPVLDDWVPAYSNSNEQLTFLAHVDPILTDGLSGTQLAALTAAWATADLQSAARTSTGRYLTPEEARAMLALTGQPITDAKSGITTPRIDLALAFEMLEASAEPYETTSIRANSTQRGIIQPLSEVQHVRDRDPIEGTWRPDVPLLLDEEATTTECLYNDSLWMRGRNLTGVAQYLSCRAMSLGRELAILGGANIRLQAGELIRFQPGFRVKTGARVEVRTQTPTNDSYDDTYNYSTECPASGHTGRIDSWSFYRCECTSYVADKLNEVGLRGGKEFKNSYGFSGVTNKPSCEGKTRWGNASCWDDIAAGLGIPCNDQPQRGSVAWFERPVGHVAFVETVNGDFIDVTEYNWDLDDDGNPGHDFGMRTLERGTDAYPDCFIQIPLAETGPPINDTGIDWCADGNTNFLDCYLVGGYAGQDGGDGRDVTHNDPSDGHAGFSFTKLDDNGNDLLADAADWSCVRDNVTGLIWEVKTDDGGLHDKDDRYNWYNTDPSTNGGFDGYADDDRNICAGYESHDPASYCNTQAFVERVNQRGLCGTRDWRLPSSNELLSIVSNDRNLPAIDTDYFPNTVSSWFWSSSPNAVHSVNAWSVDFRYGYVYDYYKNLGRAVRLVRAGQ